MATPQVPLMPRATAVWLIDNTTLTFEQIGDFCGLHVLEIQGIADGEVAGGIIGKDPITGGQLSAEELKRCEGDATTRLQLSRAALKHIETEAKKKKKGRYTPVARRQDKPDAIAWLLKHCPDMSSVQITKLIGTTKKTIESIKDRSHWNMPNIKPRDPVLLGLCTQTELEAAKRKATENADKAGNKDPLDDIIESHS